MTRASRICAHGRLRRQCDLCDLEQELAALRARDIPDETLDDLVGWAFRYGLGSQSAATPMIAHVVRAYRRRLSPETRQRMVREITAAIAHGEAGRTCDIYEWEQTRAVLAEGEAS